MVLQRHALVSFRTSLILRSEERREQVHPRKQDNLNALVLPTIILPASGSYIMSGMSLDHRMPT